MPSAPRPDARTARARRPRRGVVAVVAAVVGAALVAGCGPTAGKRLLLADGQVGRDGTRIWAVEPGQATGPGTLIASGAAQPQGVQVGGLDGRPQLNNLGWAWQDRVLLSYVGLDGSRVTLTDPGDKGELLGSSSSSQLAPAVLRRGVFVRGGGSCTLATAPGERSTVGDGTCVMSEDERWVLSYDSSGRGATLRDLRSDEQRRLGGSAVTSGSALGRDARTLLAESTGDGVTLRLYDSTDGRRLRDVGRYDAVAVEQPLVGARGFVVLARTGQELSLLYVDTDGALTVVDRGEYLQPITTGAAITYLSLAAGSPDGDRLVRWEPGGEREVLLEGRVGAAPLDGESVVAMRERPGAVDFFREGAGGKLERNVTLRVADAGQVVVSRAFVLGDEVFLQVDGPSGSSLVVVDTHGEGRVPVRGWGSLSLDSVDHDGSVLLTGSRSPVPGSPRAVLVVPAGKDRPLVRARFSEVRAALLHDGTVFVTVADRSSTQVRSMAAQGDLDQEVLYRNRQLAGATWPEQGGASPTRLINRTAIAASAQQQQGAGGGTGGGTTPGA